MLFSGLGSVHIVLPQEAFSSLRSQFFTIRTNPKPENNMFIFSCHRLVLITNGFNYTTSSLNQLSTSDFLKSSQRASNSDARQRKMY